VYAYSAEHCQEEKEWHFSAYHQLLLSFEPQGWNYFLTKNTHFLSKFSKNVTIFPLTTSKNPIVNLIQIEDAFNDFINIIAVTALPPGLSDREIC